jgi:hypothetical protein
MSRWLADTHKILLDILREGNLHVDNMQAVMRLVIDLNLAVDLTSNHSMTVWTLCNSGLATSLPSSRTMH